MTIWNLYKSSQRCATLQCGVKLAPRAECVFVGGGGGGGGGGRGGGSGE